MELNTFGFTSFFQGDSIMSGKTDEVKGRVKEAAGAITDDEKLRREGKMDPATGKVKQAAEKALDKAKDVAQRLNEKFSEKTRGEHGE